MNWSEYWLEMAQRHLENGNEKAMWAVLLLNHKEAQESLK